MPRPAPLTTFTISYGGVQLTDDPAALKTVFIGPTNNSGGLLYYSGGVVVSSGGLNELLPGSAVNAQMLGITSSAIIDGTLATTNPLGMAYYAATQTGATDFYIMATSNATSATMSSAMAKAAKSESVYGIYPIVQESAGVVNDAITIVNSYSSPEKAQMKRTWVYANPTSGAVTSGAAAVAAQISAKAAGSYGSTKMPERINYVYAQSNTVGGVPCENAQYIIPVLATMRGYMAPHAPLTDVTIPGVEIGESLLFQDEDYEQLNDAGVWVCFKDGRGENVTRHAVTTCTDDTVAMEDSAVSNGDNIVRTVRDQVSWLRGNCNVTPALIDKIYANVQNAFNRILARNYSDLIGPQILEVNSVVVKQDPNNTAGVIGTFDLDLPDVYLRGDFTFNLF